MAPVKVETYVVGSVQTNCYFAINEETRETLIIDPGASAGRLAERLAEQQLKPEAILLTHGHFDHAGGAAELAAHFGIKVYAHERERETLDTPSLNLSGWGGGAESYHVDEFLKDDQEIDPISVCFTRRVTRREAAAFTSHTRISCFPATHCFICRWEEPISPEAACRRSCVPSVKRFCRCRSKPEYIPAIMMRRP